MIVGPNLKVEHRSNIDVSSFGKLVFGPQGVIQNNEQEDPTIYCTIPYGWVLIRLLRRLYLETAERREACTWHDMTGYG